MNNSSALPPTGNVKKKLRDPIRDEKPKKYRAQFGLFFISDYTLIKKIGFVWRYHEYQKERQ